MNNVQITLSPMPCKNALMLTPALQEYLQLHLGDMDGEWVSLADAQERVNQLGLQQEGLLVFVEQAWDQAKG